MIFSVVFGHLSYSTQPLLLYLSELFLQINKIFQNERHCQLSLSEFLFQHYSKKLGRWANQYYIIEFDRLAVYLIDDVDNHFLEVVAFLQLSVFMVICFCRVSRVDELDDNWLYLVVAIVIQEQTVVKKEIF